MTKPSFHDLQPNNTFITTGHNEMLLHEQEALTRSVRFLPMRATN